MIQSKFKITLLLLIFTCGTFSQIIASNDKLIFSERVKKSEFTKKINKEFDISADGTVSLKNKYGKIDLETWDQKRVKIDIEIKVNARNQADADDIFERIKVEFSNGPDYVNAETKIESNKKSYWGDGKGDFNINYVVHMPKSCNLNLSNKYGHSDIAEINGKAKVAVKYGDLTMEGVNNDCEISVGYGNGTILKAGSAKIDVKYSKIKIKKAEDVDVTSKYSKVYIDEASDVKSLSKYDSYRLGNLQELKNEGKYDHFEIDNINLINATAKYSDFNVDKLKKEGAFSLQYGNVVIATLLKNFTSLRLEGKYTDFKIITEQGTDFVLDAATHYAGVKYPDGFKVTHEKEKGSSHEVKGYKGSSGASLIKARIEYGGIKIK